MKLRLPVSHTEFLSDRNVNEQMLRIDCPWCGSRDQVEFRCGGPARSFRPADPQAVSDREWAEYLFYRDNPKGVHCERWAHSWGCRQWFTVERDTVSHEILATYPMAGTQTGPRGGRPA